MAKVKEIFNMHPTATQNTDEIVFQVADDTVNAVIDFQERNFQGDTLQIFTVTGSGGTQLIQDTDYVIEDINEYYTGVTGVDVYRKLRIINATYHAVDLYIPVSSLSLYGDFVDETDINRLQDQIDTNETNIDAILSGTAQALLGQEVVLPYSEDLSKYGLLQYTFDKVSTSRYPEWYAKIGDTFEQQHLDAGQAASGAGYFYPTPVPGAYGRSALPDISLTDSEFRGSPSYLLMEPTYADFNFRNGTPFKFIVESGTAPTGLTDGEVYYLIKSGTIYYFATSEDNAINNTRITYTDSGSGTFKLTQEGLSLENAMKNHVHVAGGSSSGGSTGVLLNNAADEGTPLFTGDPFVSGDYGDIEVSNENRPDTTIKFYYTKVENVIPFVGEPVSGVKYDTGWVANSDWTASTFNIAHNLDDDLLNLDVKFYVSTTGTDETAELIYGMGIRDAGSSEQTSLGFKQVDVNNFNVYTGVSGIRIPVNDGTGGSVLLSTATRYYRVVVEKKNYASPILNQPKYTNQTYTLGDGDSISLTAQTSIILVDSTTADMSIDITGFSYNGHKVIIKNIGTANECTVINSIGGWLKSATVSHGESASCEVANDELTEGDFKFIWDVENEIGFQNNWVNFETAQRRAKIVYKGGFVYLSGIIKDGSAVSVCFTLPAGLGHETDSTKSVPALTSGGTTNIDARDSREILIGTYTSYCYLDAMSFPVKIGV